MLEREPMHQGITAARVPVADTGHCGQRVCSGTFPIVSVRRRSATLSAVPSARGIDARAGVPPPAAPPVPARWASSRRPSRSLSHRRMVKSPEPEASVVPSGLNESEKM